MSTLASQQAALLEALWAPRHAAAMDRAAGAVAAGPLAGRGLRAYRSNARALAVRSLEAAYPVVAQLVGEEAFGFTAAGLWQAHPPQRGDLAQWGEALAGYLAQLPQLAEEPYLPDVARCEWAVHRAATAADASARLESFALLGECDPARLSLRLAPGTGVLRSAWPIASIVNAHVAGDPSLEEAGVRLREARGECALVWRHGLRPRVRECSEGEWRFLSALLYGVDLEQALAAAGDFDFSGWLAPAVQAGLLVEAFVLGPGEQA